MNETMVVFERITAIIIWPMIILLVLINRKWATEILDSIFNQATKFSGFKLNIL